MENDLRQMHNEILKQKEEEFRKEKVLDKAAQIVEKSANLEILPINNYILVKPYEVNPYQQIEVSEGGIAMNSLDKGIHLNRETGEMEKSDEWAKFATVIECSPNAKYVQPGDDIMYRKMQAVPVPFFQLGMEVVAENQILVVINEKLKARFEGKLFN